jgi:hypothetical protein
MAVSGQRHALAALTQAALHRRLDGPKNWYGLLENRKISYRLPALEPQTVKPEA